MRVLVLGGSGMLGHKVWQVFDELFETYATLRRPLASYRAAELFDPARVVDYVSAEDFDGVVRAVEQVRPEAVVNCIGIVKQAPAGKDPLSSILVNSLFPHRVAHLCGSSGSRLIQISTDCVFSGSKGAYREDDPPDAGDLYGLTKLLGETAYPHTITIRTSIIGRELEGSYGLLEWFLGQNNGRVNGYTRAVFSGLTTSALAALLATAIVDYPDLSGIWHVASEPVSKFDLLRRLADAYDHPVEIEPDPSVAIDRSLDGRRFHERTGIRTPDWSEMIDALARDPTPYVRLRS